MMTQLLPCPRCRCMRRKIEASRCDLRVGDQVAPDTVLGADYETGEPVTAGCHGEVAAVHFSGGEHALEVIIRPRPV